METIINDWKNIHFYYVYSISIVLSDIINNVVENHQNDETSYYLLLSLDVGK